MTAALALILVSIIDLPSFVTVIGALKIQRWWKLPFVVFLAVIFKEVFGALFTTFYEPFRLLPFTLIGQTMVAVLVFRSAQAIRKRHADDPKKLRIAKIRYVTILVIILGSLCAGMVYWGMQRGNAHLKTAAEHTESAKVTTPAHNSNAVPKDAFNKLFLPADVSKSGDRRIDESVYLYREPVELYWNDWAGKNLSEGKAYITGTGKTVSFEGIIKLNCARTSGHTWLTATNGRSSKAMTEAELEKTVPVEVIAAAFGAFCSAK